MPLGSSSDAPVMKPGPRIFPAFLSGLRSAAISAAVPPVAPAGSECGMTRWLRLRLFATAHPPIALVFGGEACSVLDRAELPPSILSAQPDSKADDDDREEVDRRGPRLALGRAERQRAIFATSPPSSGDASADSGLRYFGGPSRYISRCWPTPARCSLMKCLSPLGASLNKRRG